MSSTVPIIAPAQPAAEATATRKTQHTQVFGPFVVGLSGVSSSLVCAETARRVADLLHLKLHLVTVIEPPTVAIDAASAMAGAILPGELWETPDERLRAMQTYLRDAKTSITPFVAEARIGNPVAQLAAAAEDHHAGMVAVNSHSHLKHNPANVGAFALKLLQTVHCPVLSVSRNTAAGYRKVVVAVDFSALSIRAALLGAKLVADGGELSLVHVDDEMTYLPEDSANNGSVEAEKMLTRVAAYVKRSTPAPLRIETRKMQGEVAPMLHGFCMQRSVDLLCIGVRRRNLLQRLVIAGIAPHVLNRSEYDVLGVPALDPASNFELTLGGFGTATSLESSAWKAILDAFSRRNVGRTAELEWESPVLGAQRDARNFELIGVTYDEDSGKADVMLRSKTEAGVHLSRQFVFIRSVAIKQRDNGTDETLQLIGVEGTMLLALS
ncbi:MAG: universal stress protein [Gemmatimonadaceae bacterium]